MQKEVIGDVLLSYLEAGLDWVYVAVEVLMQHSQQTRQRVRLVKDDGWLLERMGDLMFGLYMKPSVPLKMK